MTHGNVNSAPLELCPDSQGISADNRKSYGLRSAVDTELYQYAVNVILNRKEIDRQPLADFLVRKSFDYTFEDLVLAS